MEYDESLKRFDRIVSILIQLQSKRVVKAQDLANRFAVSLRTIYRDIRTLESSGIPIYSEAGTGYSLMDGYRLPPVMFTKEEVLSFIAAEKLMQRFSDQELGGHYSSAMYKLKAVLRSDEKDLASDLETKVRVREEQDKLKKSAPNALSVIFRAIGEKKRIVIDYESVAALEPGERMVEPIGVMHENRNWYLYAFCHLRNDYRQFRADRIHRIQMTELPFSREHDDPENLFRLDEQPLQLIRIMVDSRIAKYLNYDRDYYGFVSQRILGEQVEMTFQSRDPQDAFARWFMMFAEFSVILEPESLKHRVAELLRSALQKME